LVGRTPAGELRLRMRSVAEAVHLFICVVHRLGVREVEQVRVIADKGFEGCIHGRPRSKRQVLLMEAETLERFGLSPGIVRENITTRGLDLRALCSGVRLRVGSSLLEVTVACEPCSRMDEVRPGLQDELRGQRGWLCRVVEEGVIRRGDAIELVPEPEGTVAEGAS
jgi:MOSC domain-containing protein YiiM